MEGSEFMDEISEIWPQWHTESLIGAGSFGKVYKVSRKTMDNVSYAAVKVVQIPQEPSEVRDLQQSGMDFSQYICFMKT